MFQNKEPEYTKVRRKGGRLRDPHSESQGTNSQVAVTHHSIWWTSHIECFLTVTSQIKISESDNLGSTDSEVKKILTLHLPISEYDTLGSDSDGDGRAASQELVSFGHRMRGK